MKYKLIKVMIVIWLFIITSALANAVLTDDLIGSWKLDLTTGHIKDDLNNYNGTSTTAIRNQHGKIGRSFFNGYTNVGELDSQLKDSVTLMGWVNVTNFPGSTSASIISKFGSGSDLSYRLYADQSNRFCWHIYNIGGSSAQVCDSVSSGNTGEWYHVVGTYDGSNATLYINGVKIASSVLTGNIYDSSAGVPTVIGRTQRHQVLNGYIDDVLFYNRSLSNSEITTIYNNNFGCTYPFTACQQPVITLFTSLINNTENYNKPDLNFTYNGSFSGGLRTTDFVNITFYVNNVLNKTLLNINITKNNKINISLTNLELPLNMSLNVSNFETSANTGLIYYNIDTLPPRVNITGLVDNQSFILNDILETNVSMFDPNLFAYNISLINLDSKVVLENYFISNLTNITNAVNKTSRTLNTLGNFSFDVFVYDSHTKNKIKNYKIGYLNNGLQFEDKIKITGIDLKSNKNHNVIKKKDRYEFELDFKKGLNWHSIELESTDNLYYIENSKYNGHFVDFVNKKWIDFESNGIEDTIIKKITNNKYEIKFKFDKTKEKIKFNSIGDLNEFSNQRFFTVGIIPTVSNNVTEINLSGIESSINNVSNSIINFAFIIFFIFMIIIFILIELAQINNKPIIILFTMLFVAFQIKFINMGENTLGWMAFAGWVLGLINIINSDDE